MNQDDELLSAKILIVDDEPANVLLLERALQRAGYTAVRSTMDSQQALELYRDLRPDMVLLDVHMPEVNGLELLSQLNDEIPAAEFVPIVVMTADVQHEVRMDALARGAKDFLTRPLDLGELQLRLRTLLRARFLFRSLEQKATADPRAGAPPAAGAPGGRDDWDMAAVYFRCKSCGADHPAPIQFLDRKDLERTHLSTNVFRCPVRKLSARYSKADLVWKGSAQPSSEPGGLVRMKDQMQKDA